MTSNPPWSAVIRVFIQSMSYIYIGDMPSLDLAMVGDESDGL